MSVREHGYQGGSNQQTAGRGCMIPALYYGPTYSREGTLSRETSQKRGVQLVVEYPSSSHIAPLISAM